MPVEIDVLFQLLELILRCATRFPIVLQRLLQVVNCLLCFCHLSLDTFVVLNLSLGFSELALELEQLVVPDLLLLAIKVFLAQLLNDLGRLLKLLLEQTHQKSRYIAFNIVCQL